MGKPFDRWTIAVFMTMRGYWPAIFRKYTVRYVGAWDGKLLKADNDNGVGK